MYVYAHSVWPDVHDILIHAYKYITIIMDRSYLGSHRCFPVRVYFWFRTKKCRYVHLYLYIGCINRCVIDVLLYKSRFLFVYT